MLTQISFLVLCTGYKLTKTHFLMICTAHLRLSARFLAAKLLQWACTIIAEKEKKKLKQS